MSKQDPALQAVKKEKIPKIKAKEKVPTLGVVTGVGGDDFKETGLASWYGRDFDGKPTASGEIFDSRKLTAAHKTLALGTVVLVRNLENDKEVFVKINDRGPFVEGRILDISEYGAEVLDYKQDGLTQVGIRVVSKANKGVKAVNNGLTHDYFKGATVAPVGSGLGESPAPEDNDENNYANEHENVIEDKGQNHYSVQVGVYNNLRHARKMQRLLQNYRQNVNVIRSGKKYIVRIGEFKQRVPAENLKKELNSDDIGGFVKDPY